VRLVLLAIDGVQLLLDEKAGLPNRHGDGLVASPGMSDELPWKPKSRPCEWCGEPVDQLGTRAPRLYCRRSHRQRAFEARQKLELQQRVALAEAELHSRG
jgi:hypothetical protein